LAPNIGARQLAQALPVIGAGAWSRADGEAKRETGIATVPIDGIQSIEIWASARALLQGFALYRIGGVCRTIEVGNLISVLEPDDGDRDDQNISRESWARRTGSGQERRHNAIVV
jgi:hypothetical protein